jgi:hypothetical protein
MEQVAMFAEGERKSVVLKFAPRAVSGAPPASSPEQPGGALALPAPEPGGPPPVTAKRSGAGRTLGVVALVAGGVGLAASGITALVAIGKKGEIEDSDSCDGLKCNPEAGSLVNNYNSMRTASSVTFFVGLGLTGLGTVLLFTSSTDEKKPAVSLRLGPASANVRGSF